MDLKNRFSSNIGRLVCMLVLAGMSSVPAFAEPVPGAPAIGAPGIGSTQASRIEEQFQQPADSGAESTSAPLTVQREETEVPPGADKTSLTLNQVVIDGATVYTPDQINAMWSQYQGKQVSLAQIYQIADDLTVKYRNDGYILAKAVIPPQKIDNGVVHIRVIEGYIIKVDYDGDTRGNKAILDQYAIEIQGDRPLRSETLERYLLMINDLPGVSAGSILQPAPNDPGAANLTIILDQKPYEAYATIDNRGSRYIGQFQDTAGARFNSLLGEFDQTRLQVASVPGKEKELQFGDAEESIPIGLEGTTLTIGGTYAHSRPGFTLETADIESEDKTFDVAVAHPVIRSRSENLNLIFDFDARSSDSTDNAAFPHETIYDDQLRVFRLTANYDMTDNLMEREGTNQVSFEAHKGIQGLGASASPSSLADRADDNLSRTSGDANFTKLTAELSRVQQIYDKFSVQVAATGQYSFTPLLVSEQFSLGGAQYLRSYDPSEFLGDSGYATKAELRYSDSVPTGPFHSYQLYVYYDEGQVWNKEPQPGDPENGLTAQSVGGGIRVSVTDYVSGYLEISKPVARIVPTEGSTDPRAFFSLQLHY
jgi:hemolysin activation/secretion protein